MRNVLVAAVAVAALALGLATHAQDAVCEVFYGDLQSDGTLANVRRRGCPIPPPHKGCSVAPHIPPVDGAKRVLLNEWPADKYQAPFVFIQTGTDKDSGLSTGTVAGGELSADAKLDTVACPPRVMRAMCRRLSSSWEKLPDEDKAVVQKIIDAAESDIAATLSK